MGYSRACSNHVVVVFFTNSALPKRMVDDRDAALFQGPLHHNDVRRFAQMAVLHCFSHPGQLHHERVVQMDPSLTPSVDASPHAHFLCLFV